MRLLVLMHSSSSGGSGGGGSILRIKWFSSLILSSSSIGPLSGIPIKVWQCSSLALSWISFKVVVF